MPKAVDPGPAWIGLLQATGNDDFDYHLTGLI